MKHFYKFETEAEYTSQKSSLPLNHVALVNGVVFINDKEGTAAALSNYYTKEEIDAKGYLTSHQDISGKANSADVYTKTEIDNRVSPLESKLEVAQVYRTGTGAPASTLGNDGDIYLQTS